MLILSHLDRIEPCTMTACVRCFLFVASHLQLASCYFDCHQAKCVYFYTEIGNKTSERASKRVSEREGENKDQ